MQRLATRIILVLLFLQLLLLIVSIPGHPLHIDEAWIGEQAYFLAHDGHVHSNLFEGLAGHEHRTVVYHRLFVAAGAWMAESFIWGIGPLRAVPVACTLLLMGAMAFYMWRERETEPLGIMLPVIIFLLIPISFYHAKIFRPEMMMTLFGFMSYWLLERGAHRGKGTEGLFPIGLAGFLAGAAALTHLYGLIFVAAGVYLLLRTRCYTGLNAFLLAAALPFIPYVLDITEHRELFDEQINNPIAAKKTSFTLLTPFANLLEEHKRLFRKPEIILVMLLSIIATIPGWRAASAAGDRRRSLFFEYTLALILLLGMVSGDKLVTRYAIPLFPFLAIAISSSIVDRPGLLRNNKPYRALFIVALSLFVIFGIGYQIRETFRKGEHPAELNAEIGEQLPSGARVVGPMNMIFDEIDRLHIIGLYLASKERNDSLTLDGAIEFANRHRAGYIVTNRFMSDEEVIDGTDSKSDLGGKEFVVMKRTNEYLILERSYPAPDSTTSVQP